jgi:hypothetical protein
VSGAIVNATAGENLAFGNVCYYKSDSKYYKANADDSGTITTQLLMALETIAQDASGWFVEKGYVYDSGWSFSTGAVVYLGVTDGLADESQPSTNSRIIGMGDNTDLYFDGSKESRDLSTELYVASAVIYSGDVVTYNGGIVTY